MRFLTAYLNIHPEFGGLKPPHPTAPREPSEKNANYANQINIPSGYSLGRKSDERDGLHALGMHLLLMDHLCRMKT
jgi:hypothetical protein